MCQSLSPCHWLESLRQKVAREALSQQSSPREVETSAPTHPATIIKNKITRPTPAPPALYVPSAAPEHPRIPLPHRPPLPPPFLFIPPYFFFFKHFFSPSLLSPFLPPPHPSPPPQWRGHVHAARSLTSRFVLFLSQLNPSPEFGEDPTVGSAPRAPQPCPRPRR